jgi:hypothetical protein
MDGLSQPPDGGKLNFDGGLRARSAENELTESWRAVANAKLIEYRRQCWRLAGLVRSGTLHKQSAIDKLWEIAIAHALVRALGEERVQSIIFEAFAGRDFRPMHAEVA